MRGRTIGTRPVKMRFGAAVPDPDRSLGLIGPSRCKLNEWRQRAGLDGKTLVAMVRRAGDPAFTRTILSGLQTGRMLPYEHEWRALCRALCCDLRDLWPDPHTLALIDPKGARVMPPPTPLLAAQG